MADAVPAPLAGDARRRVRAWVLYDWANSAFATTVVSAVLPVYFATVAGATLPSPARATQVLSLATSAALVVVAVASPVLGALADLAATRRRMLGVAMGIGATATAGLALVGEGDWLLAAVLFGIGRVGFGTGNVFYDALLPHVAPPGHRDRVSAQGFALGYLGGGLLLAVNVAMVLALPDDGLGARLSFLTVAAWWAAFSLPLLRHGDEPPPTDAPPGGAGVRAAVRQARRMLVDLRGLRDLRRFLFAYLVYNDGINVVIGVAAIYGAELGFGATELLLAILLVQFVGVPYSLLWGRLWQGTATGRGRVLLFLAANIALVPLYGVVGRLVLPADVAGAAPPTPPTITATGTPSTFVGVGDALASTGGAARDGDRPPPVRLVTPGAPLVVGVNSGDLPNGQDVVLTHDAGPTHGRVRVLVDGVEARDDDGEPLWDDASAPVAREGLTVTVPVRGPGRHLVTVEALDAPGRDTRPGVRPAPVAVSAVEVLPPRRDSALGTVLAGLLAVQVLAGGVAVALGGRAAGLAARLDTRDAITLAVAAYVVVGAWGFALDTVVEFWALAWLVAVVQGGSQALSRSLFATLVPPRRTGEFFGLFSILSKTASFLSPLLFVASVAVFDSSRPAVLALAVVFGAGLVLLRGVDVAAGRARAASA